MHENITSVRIRYADTDQMGVVYHGNYPQFFEIGRTEWLRSIQTTYKSMEKKGIMLPVISLQCSFIKPAVYDEIISIKTVLKKTPSVKAAFYHEIFNEKKELLCTGETVVAFMDANTKKPVRCPDYILEKLERKINI